MLVLTSLILGLFAGAVPASAAPNDPPGYFSETGYRVGDAKFWEYFRARGGVRTFGYPVSRVFQLDGFKVQIFQRRVLQLGADGNVSQLNLLDQQYMPYTRFNNATVPAQDNALLATAPAPGSPNYGQAILEYVLANAPDAINNIRPGFGQTFRSSVTMAEAYPQGGGNAGLLQGIWLEMWGVPTSRPAADPANGNFVYVRFQRGIMHYDATTGTTQGLLLGDYFKSMLTGSNLPPDLAEQAKASPYFLKYDNTQPNGLKAGQTLANANLKDAFQTEPPAPAPTALDAAAAPTRPTQPAPTAGSNLGGGPLRLGWQAHLYGQPHGRNFGLIKQSGFGWVKQQVRWATHNPADLDAAVASANAAGVQFLASVVTTPPSLRGGKPETGPPDDFKQFGAFVGGLAARYKGRIHAYELWNEQNLVTEWQGRPINACEYVTMLREGYDAVKAADPAAIVVSGAMTPNGLNNPNLAIDDKLYLEQMYKCNNGEFLRIADAIGVHMAGFGNAPEDEPGKSSTGATSFNGHMSFFYKRLDDLHSVMRANNDPRSMWVTEYEWAHAKPPVPKGYEWTTILSEEQVGDFYVRGIQMAKNERPWIGAIFCWNLNFRTFQDYHHHETAIFGVINEDWSPRSIFNKLAAMPK